MPKQPEQNLLWRKQMVHDASKDSRLASDLFCMAARDPLFWWNAFVWTYDPRRPETVVPFITYPCQDAAIVATFKAMGMIRGYDAHDILFEKSRDMGASWIMLATDVWAWKFRHMLSFLWVSRKEELVWKSGDPKAMFWKAEFILKHEPWFLKQPVVASKLHMYNESTESTIDGESTNTEVAVGDRRTAVTLDEFARVPNGDVVDGSTADVTNCRKINSTPKGAYGAYYRLSQLPSMHKIVLPWEEHPVKAVGLYKVNEDGEIDIIDKTYSFPKDYQFVTDSRWKVRSPWFDKEDARRGSEKWVAEHLQREYHGAGDAFFDIEVIDRLLAETVADPIEVGMLSQEEDKPGYPDEWVEDRQGETLLWFVLPQTKSVPPESHRFAMGVDVGAGTGASASVISVGDTTIGEKVAQHTTRTTSPEALAEYAVALAKWFNNALLLWENQGPGTQFRSRVMDLGYDNIYLNRNEQTWGRKVTDKPGWHASGEAKRSLLGKYRQALNRKLFINRSSEALRECKQIIFSDVGEVEHSSALDDETPASGRKKNHGDHVIADALCWLGMCERGRKQEEHKPVAPVGSIAWIMEQREQRKSSDAKWAV